VTAARRRQAARTGLALAAVALAGLAFKAYDGPGATWVAGRLAGAAYVAGWCLAARLIFARAAPGRIAVVVCTATVGLEFLQLWHPAWLEVLRRPWVGQVLLGSSFDPLDLPFYPLGALAGWGLLRRLDDAPSA